ncbi:hypothetical protein BpHYR1_028183 [Brachionus plicatilis]|uniref:HAT C-terminal dimerisation domain-containing protein n=1 Tax=Brachionus plicatilis TaxID=10195 RepID=A0A3M7QY76_BRAPC|nr:hypothetical protein BpHYR1_028183 [Brachionus plicatilis]
MAYYFFSPKIYFYSNMSVNVQNVGCEVRFNSIFSIQKNLDNLFSAFCTPLKKTIYEVYDTINRSILGLESHRPVERFFSKSGYINRPHMSRLTARNLEATTSLVSNTDLVSFFNYFCVFSLLKKINFILSLVLILNEQKEGHGN